MPLAESRSRVPELLVDLIDKTTRLLTERAGLDDVKALEVAEAIADNLRHDWGGQQIYFPKGVDIEISQRDYELYNRWNGTTAHLSSLAKEYDISMQWAYKITKTIRTIDSARRQDDLFPKS